MAITITLTDDNTPDPAIITAETKAAAFEALYDELAARNDGDCAQAVDEGYIFVPGASYPHKVYLLSDPEGFWQTCCDVMLSDNQDYQIDA